MKYALWFVLILATTIFGAWVIQGSDFFMTKTFAPKYEEVRRETFKQSQAYNDGMAQELASAQVDYAGATPGQKQAIGALLLHRFAGYDLSKLSPDQRTFLEQLRQGGGGGQ